MDILIASHNKKKAAELESMLGKYGFRVLSFDDIGFHDEIEETGETFEENSYIKAKVACDMGYIGVADDSGLCVDYLSGRPGVYSARYSGADANDSKNNAKLLSELEGVPEEERGARFVSVITAVFPGEKETVITGKGMCEGRILESPRGDNGFGYDPLFYYEPFKKTFAELTSEEKNSISHRGKAIEDFVKKIIIYMRGKNDNE